MVDLSTIEVWLKQARKAHDLTQKELAHRIGCSVRLIEKIERGERRPSRQMAELLAEVMEIPDEQRATFLRFARFSTAGKSPVTATAEEYAPWRKEPRHAGGLPRPSSPFVGREGEIETIASMLRSYTVRLSTITGPPGIGKTRLALEVARAVSGSFPDGAYFVPLDTVSAPDELLPAVAQTLRLHLTGSSFLFEELRDHFAGKHILLILDTFEHLIAAGPVVARLLEASPGLSVLATSRELLHLSVERPFRLLPLTLPERPPQHKDSLEQLFDAGVAPHETCSIIAASEAVRLFVQRAEAVSADFSLTRDNAPVIAEICECLQGLPLAIELAAARIRALSPVAILDMLHNPDGLDGRENTLSLLTRGPKDLPPRLQTVRSAIAGSYTLLDDREKALFRKLSVFADGFTLDAAEAISTSGDAGECDPQAEAVDLLVALADKSLLQHEMNQAGVHRFRMLEVIREYGIEKLREQGEEQQVRSRHARFYAARTEDARRSLRRTEHAAWLALLESERENLRAALSWAWRTEEPQLGSRLVNALWEFWLRRGYWHEGLQQVETALRHPALAAPTSARAMTLLGAGFLLYVKVDLPQAASKLNEALAISRDLGEREITVHALNLLGQVESAQGNKGRAREHHEEALDLSQRTQNPAGAAFALYGLALQYLEAGEMAKAQQTAERSVAVARTAGDELTVGYALQALVLAEIDAGQYAAAGRHAQEALAIFQSLRALRGTAHTLQGLGYAEAGAGNLQHAVELLQQSIMAFSELEYLHYIPLSLAGLARVAVQQKRGAKAALLFGAAFGILARLGNPDVPAARIRRDPALAIIRAELEPSRLEKEWARGEGMSIEEVKAYLALWETGH